MNFIQSRSNDKIKLLHSLLTSAKARLKNELFVLEGARLCADAVGFVEIVDAFFTGKALEKYKAYTSPVLKEAGQSHEIAEDLAGRISATKASQGVFCICKTPSFLHDFEALDPLGNYLALENIQDPANLGAIARSAEALGISGLIIDGGCDIFNPKALRAAMGSSLRLKIFESEDLASSLIPIKQKGFITLAFTPCGNPDAFKSLHTRAGNVCLIGNEGSGLSAETLKACDIEVAIPMKGKAQSLNAAAAAAIIMWELVR